MLVTKDWYVEHYKVQNEEMLSWLPVRWLITDRVRTGIGTEYWS